MRNASEADNYSGENGANTPISGWLFPKEALKVPGNSGCRLQLKSYEGRIAVEKSSDDKVYTPRLKLQIAKQRRASQNCPLGFVRIPRILAEEDHSEGGYAATMEHLIYPDALGFFSVANKPAISQVAKMVLGYVDYLLSGSPVQEVPVEIFLTKLREIGSRLVGVPNQDFYVGWCDGLYNQLLAKPTLALPIGECHGDLTFSNILIAADQKAIGLIDFLDSYLDSPLVDIAKLRQDTQFFWSLQMLERPVDQARIRQILQFVDAIVVDHYQQQTWFADALPTIQAINLLRIVPYARHPRIHQFIISSLKSLNL